MLHLMPRRASRIRLLLPVAALALSAAACGGDDTTATPGSAATSASSIASSAASAPPSASSSAAPSASSSASSAPDPAAGADVRVGLAYDVGGRGDKSFNDAAAAGLDQAKTELGVMSNEVSPNASGSNRDSNLELLAEEGFNPVIAVGFAYAEAVGELSEQYPDTTFAIIDDSSNADAENVKSLVFAEEEGSFLVGAAAALKSETNTIGFVGGVEVPLIKKFEAGYIAGAKQVKPDVEVQVRYLSQPPDFSGFGSPDKGEEAAAGMFDRDADVVFHAAGGSGTGVFQAALDAEGLAIGVDSDQYLGADPELQPVILTSMVKSVDLAVYDAISSFVEGDTAGGVETYDLSVDGVGYSTSGGFVDDIAPQLEELKAQIVAGEIEVPTTP